MGAIEFGANGVDREWGGSVKLAVGCCQMANFTVGASWIEGETALERSAGAERRSQARRNWTLLEDCGWWISGEPRRFHASSPLDGLGDCNPSCRHRSMDPVMASSGRLLGVEVLGMALLRQVVEGMGFCSVSPWSARGRLLVILN
jgi:hypothetical protein